MGIILRLWRAKGNYVQGMSPSRVSLRRGTRRRARRVRASSSTAARRLHAHTTLSLTHTGRARTLWCRRASASSYAVQIVKITPGRAV